jgi:hypothetical protein
LRAACQQPILRNQFSSGSAVIADAPRFAAWSMRMVPETNEQTIGCRMEVSPTRAAPCKRNVMEADDGAVQWYPERCEYLSDFINGEWLRALRERFNVGT